MSQSTSEPRKVSLIGLGVMGGAIARHIAEAGHELTIHNRSPERARKWTEENPDLAHRIAANPAHAAQDADVVITCVGNDDDLADVVLGPNGVFRSQRIVHVGKAGSGQIAKMANQICIAGNVAALAEAVRFAQASHLDMDKVYEAISGGAAQSWQMDNRWKTMDNDAFDFGFAIDWMRKDLGLSLEEGRGLGVSLPVAALIDQFFAEIQAMGGGRLDTSAIIKRLPKKGKK